MRIELVQATENAGKLIADIASICYGKEQATNPEKLLKSLFNQNHHSTLEHIYYTFKIEGISRACLSQLTRHRHASYTVRSSRYCSESDQGFISPKDLIKNEEYEDMLDSALRNYEYLIARGVKKEDARFILPQALKTDLYMSCNLRELIHIAELRTSKQAQWEIRDLVNEMVNLVIQVSPELKFMFEDNQND